VVIGGDVFQPIGIRRDPEVVDDANIDGRSVAGHHEGGH